MKFFFFLTMVELLNKKFNNNKMTNDIEFANKLAQIEKKVAILKIACSLNSIDNIPKNFQQALNSVQQELLKMFGQLDDANASETLTKRLYFKVCTTNEQNKLRRLEWVGQSLNEQLRNCSIDNWEVKHYRVVADNLETFFLISFESELLPQIKRIFKMFPDVYLTEMSNENFERDVKKHFFK